MATVESECSICCEEYLPSGPRVPVKLVCDHIICNEYPRSRLFITEEYPGPGPWGRIRNILDTSTDGTARCPMCRQPLREIPPPRRSVTEREIDNLVELAAAIAAGEGSQPTLALAFFEVIAPGLGFDQALMTG